MKFSIALSTVLECANKLDEEPIVVSEITKYVNFSARLINNEFVVEVNDEVLIKYIGLVAKLTKLLESAMALMQTDIMELATLITTKKED